MSESDLIGLVSSRPEEWFRAWAIRLLVDSGNVTARDTDGLREDLANDDPSPLVRLEIASALQKVHLFDRRKIVEGLLRNSQDADDPSLSLMSWYALEPIVPLDRGWAVGMIEWCEFPNVRQFIARRIVAADDQAKDRVGVSGLVAKLPELTDPEKKKDILEGLQEAYRGRKNVSIPEGWPAALEKLSASPRAEVRNGALALALQFGDPKAIATLLETVSASGQPTDRRIDAIRLLSERRVPGLASRLLPLVDQPSLRGAAIRGLAGYDDQATPSALLRCYPQLNESEKMDAVATLSSRSSYAMALLEAVRSGVIPRGTFR